MEAWKLGFQFWLCLQRTLRHWASHKTSLGSKVLHPHNGGGALTSISGSLQFCNARRDFAPYENSRSMGLK